MFPLSPKFINNRSGRLAFHICKRNVSNFPWNFAFQVFDAPSHPGGYIERLKYLESALPSSENLRLTPFSICKGKDHLLEVLEGLLFPNVLTFSYYK